MTFHLKNNVSVYRVKEFVPGQANILVIYLTSSCVILVFFGMSGPV
jgi:hypothetical protein